MPHDVDILKWIYITIPTVIIVLCLISLYKTYAFKTQSNEDINPDRCVACGSSNLVRLAAYAYRCRECDNEGGKGLAIYNQRLLRKSAERNKKAGF